MLKPEIIKGILGCPAQFYKTGNFIFCPVRDLIFLEIIIIIELKSRQGRYIIEPALNSKYKPDVRLCIFYSHHAFILRS